MKYEFWNLAWKQMRQIWYISVQSHITIPIMNVCGLQEVPINMHSSVAYIIVGFGFKVVETFLENGSFWEFCTIISNFIKKFRFFKILDMGLWVITTATWRYLLILFGISNPVKITIPNNGFLHFILISVTTNKTAY